MLLKYNGRDGDKIDMRELTPLVGKYVHIPLKIQETKEIVSSTNTN